MIHTPENSNKIHPQALVDLESSHIDNDLIEVEKPDWFVPTSDPSLWKAPDCSDEEIQLAKSRLQKGVFIGYAKDSTVATEMPVLESGVTSRYPLLKADPKKLFYRLIRHKAYSEAYAYIALNRVDFEHQSLGRRYICQMLFDLRNQTDDHLTSDEVLIALSLFEKAGLLLNESVPNIKKYKGFITAFDIAVDLAVHKGKSDILYFYLIDANSRLLSAGLTQVQHNLRFITGNLSNELSAGKDLYSLREKNSNVAQKSERTRDQYLQDRAKYLDTLLIFLSVLQIKLEACDFNYVFNFGGGLSGEVKDSYASLIFSLHISSGLYENMLECSFINNFIKENEYQKLALILNSDFPFNYAYSFSDGFKLAKKENAIDCLKEIIKQGKEKNSKAEHDISVYLILLFLSIPYGISYFFILNFLKLVNSIKKSFSILTHSTAYTKSLLRPEMSDRSLQCAMSLSPLLATISAISKTTLAIIEYPIDVVFRVTLGIAYLSVMAVYGVVAAACYLLSNLPLFAMVLIYGPVRLVAELLTGCSQTPEAEVTYTEIEGNECALFMRDWDKVKKAGRVNTRQQRIQFVDRWEPSLISQELVENNEMIRGACAEFDSVDKAELLERIAKLNPPEWFTFSADTVANASIILNKEGLEEANKRLKRGVFVGWDDSIEDYREFEILPEGVSTRFLWLKVDKSKLFDRLVEHKAYNEFAVLVQSYKTAFELKRDFITQLISADDTVHTITILSIIEQLGLEINKLAFGVFYINDVTTNSDGVTELKKEPCFDWKVSILDRVIKVSLIHCKYELLAYFLANPKARIITIAPVMLRRTIESLILKNTKQADELLQMVFTAISLNYDHKKLRRIFDKTKLVFPDPEKIDSSGIGRSFHTMVDEEGFLPTLEFIFKHDKVHVLQLLLNHGLSLTTVSDFDAVVAMAAKYNALNCIKEIARSGTPLTLEIQLISNRSCIAFCYRDIICEVFNDIKQGFDVFAVHNCGNYFADYLYCIHQAMRLNDNSSDQEVVTSLLLSPCITLLSLPIKVMMLIGMPVIMSAYMVLYAALAPLCVGLYVVCGEYESPVSYPERMKKELSEELGRSGDNESMQFINDFNRAKQSGQFNNQEDMNTFIDSWVSSQPTRSSAPVRFFEMERDDRTTISNIEKSANT